MRNRKRNFRQGNQKCACHKEISGSCLAISLLSVTFLFLVIGSAVKNLETGIQLHGYETSPEQSPKLKIQTEAYLPDMLPDPTKDISPDLEFLSLSKAFCNMFECPSSYTMDINRATNECAQYPCLVNECCQMAKSNSNINPDPKSNVFSVSKSIPSKAFCNMFDCPDRYTIWEGTKNEQCIEYPCTVGECCLLDETEYDLSASSEAFDKSQEFKKQSNGGRPDWARGISTNLHSVSTPPVSFCSMFECPNDYTRLDGNSATVQCAKYPCLLMECCAMAQSNYNPKSVNQVQPYQKYPSKAFCNMFTCPNGYVRFQVNPTTIECTKYPCSIGECCSMIKTHI